MAISSDPVADVLDEADGPLAIGSIHGDLRIDALLGRGGMGMVYRATQLSLKRTVAIKTGLRLQGDRRLAREARAVARLQHPHIISVLALEQLGAHPAIVMEYIAGESLAARLRRGQRDELSTILHAGAALASALQATHEQRLLHRDIKPSNILIDENGTPFLADFGLARLADDESISATAAATGTPAYMSPEQLDGKSIDASSDIYSLGATLHEWITGVPPFRAAHRDALFQQILSQPCSSLRRLCPSVPRAIDRLVLRCLEKDPRARYASAAELARDLGALAEGRALAWSARTHLMECRRWWRRHRLLLVPLCAVLLVAALGALQVRANRLQRVAFLTARSELALERSQFREALEHLELALELAPAQAPEQGYLHFLRADTLLHQIAWESGSVLMPPALMRSVLADLAAAEACGLETAALHLARGFVLWFMGREADAGAEIARGRALPHVTAADHFQRAAVESLSGDVEAAERFYREAIRLQPGELVSYLQLSHLLQLRGQYPEALALLDEAERLHPADASIAGNRAWIFLQTERVPEGEALLWQLVKQRPAPAAAVDYLASMLRTQRRLPELLALYQQLNADEPEQEVWHRGLLGALIDVGRLEEAMDGIDDDLARTPGDPFARAYRLVIDLYRGDVDEAISALEALSTEDGSLVLLETINYQVEVLLGRPDALRYGRFFRRLNDLRARRTQ